MSTIKYYTWHLNQNPDDFNAHLNRSMSYLEVGDYDAALKDANQALQIDVDAYAFIAKANAYVGMGKLDEA